MIEKYKPDVNNTDGQTLSELVDKFNELVDARVPDVARPRPRTTSVPQYADQMTVLTQRMVDIPYQQLVKVKPGPLTDAVGNALTQLLAALTAFKASL